MNVELTVESQKASIPMQGVVRRCLEAAQCKHSTSSSGMSEVEKNGGGAVGVGNGTPTMSPGMASIIGGQTAPAHAIQLTLRAFSQGVNFEDAFKRRIGMHFAKLRPNTERT